MTERRYPPGDVGPVRMLAGRPGLNAVIYARSIATRGYVFCMLR